ncbi:IS21-like element helper ATPase IstB [Enterococcus sp. DIV0187]|uniref:IS21-like element helper ATPase IstB n=1 Tax=Enterococcus sp. DIV0187 TaxID=2774644 RepID=UPI003F21A8CF
MNQCTYEKMVEMRMPGMAQAYQGQSLIDDMMQLSFDERLELLVDAEFDNRHRNKITRLTKKAQLSEANAQLEDIQYFTDRGLKREVFLRLADNRYIREPKNLILTGATGSGKSYIACALENHACQTSYRVRYIRVPDLLSEIALAKAQGTYSKILKQYQTCELLILDEWLLVPASELAQQELFEIIERRYRFHATIFCSQFDTEGWHSRLGGGVLADSILDRVLPKSLHIHIEGQESIRMR